MNRPPRPRILEIPAHVSVTAWPRLNMPFRSRANCIVAGLVLAAMSCTPSTPSEPSDSGQANDDDDDIDDDDDASDDDDDVSDDDDDVSDDDDDDDDDSDDDDDDDDDNDDDDDGVPGAAFCEALMGIMCEAEAKCCSNDDWKHESFDECMITTVPACREDLRELIEDPRTAYSPALARQRLDALAEAAATCDLDVAQWFISRRTGLLSVFAGTVELGADCSPTDGEDGAALLSCTEQQACRVNPLPLAGVCGEHKVVDDLCVSHFECEESLWCTAEVGSIGGCAQRKPNGDTCEATIECTSLQCEAKQCVEATQDLVYCAARDASWGRVTRRSTCMGRHLATTRGQPRCERTAGEQAGSGWRLSSASQLRLCDSRVKTVSNQP